MSSDCRYPPNVSIIIPCFNAADTLTATLNSVVAQTHQNWEAVAVDDGSTDNTLELLSLAARSEGRLRVVQTRHGGLAAARNHGLAATRAAQVLLLDADDLLRPDAVQTLLRVSAALGGRTIVSANYEIVDEEGRASGLRREPHTEGFSFSRLLQGNPTPPLVLLPRAILSDRPFDESLRACEDWDLWLRLAHAGVARHEVRRTLFYYRLRRRSLSGKADLMFAAGHRVLSKWLKRAAEPDDVHRAMYRWACICGSAALATGDAQGLRRYLAGLPPVQLNELFWRALAAPIFWEFGRQHGAVGQSWHDHVEEWLAEIGAWLPTTPAAPWSAAIVTTLREWSRPPTEEWHERFPDLTAAFEAFLAHCAHAERVVIYGVGRNGRPLLEKWRETPDAVVGRVQVADDRVDRLTLASEGFEQTNPRAWRTWPERTVVVLTPLKCAEMREVLLSAGGREGVDFVHLPSYSTQPGRN